MWITALTLYPGMGEGWRTPEVLDTVGGNNSPCPDLRVPSQVGAPSLSHGTWEGRGGSLRGRDPRTQRCALQGAEIGGLGGESLPNPSLRSMI